MFLENASHNTAAFGWIEVICGSMFSGKTEELIRRIKRAQFAQLNVVMFKPVMDDRYDQNKVVSHDSSQIDATPVASAKELFDQAQEYDVVGVDEAQFFDEKIHNIRRPRPDDFQIKEAAEKIKKSKNPIIISGGGVFYSDAIEELSNFAIKHNIPVTQTVMGYSSMKKDHSHFLGPIGGLGGKAANNFAKKTDLAIAIGTKLGDFTTGSWTNFENPKFSLACRGMWG